MDVSAIQKKSKFIMCLRLSLCNYLTGCETDPVMWLTPISSGAEEGRVWMGMRTDLSHNYVLFKSDVLLVTSDHNAQWLASFRSRLNAAILKTVTASNNLMF